KLPAIAAAQALDGVGARDERQDGSRACLIREARRAQGYIDAAALQPVGAGALEPIDAPVLQALQLVLELERRQLQAGIELERCRIHLRGQGPAAALELMRDQPIEIQD